jgi:hypothetical protein
VNPEETALLRAVFEGTAFDDDVVDFAGALGTSPHGAGGFLLVGTPAEEPWHFAAHLTDEATWAGRDELAPTLVRWQVPDGAPPHLAVGLDRLHAVRARETLLVVSPDGAPERLLDDVQHARKHGAHVLTIETGDRDLRGLAHEALTVPVAAYFDVVQHVVSATAPGAVRRRRSVRDRLGRLLDGLQGAPRPPR